LLVLKAGARPDVKVSLLIQAVIQDNHRYRIAPLHSQSEFANGADRRFL